MKFLRNSEVKRGLLIICGISALAVTGAFVWDNRFGVFSLALCAVLTAVHAIITYRRYKRLYELSADIDRILHGGSENISLNRYAEGELGVLQSEIFKMTVRLREHKQQLINDKIFLADSIADISHQIRTPLTSINLLTQMLSKKDIPEEKRIRLVRELSGLLRRIDWLITALLKISKLDAGTVQFKSETVAWSKLIDTAVSPLLVPIELREQTLTIIAEGYFTGDTAWTCEAIGNILKNCMEHTQTGGIIKIIASETPLYSEITISDNGEGIDHDDLPHIFERFYKGKNSDGSSFGIGLALSRMIITAQNGTIKAENIPAGGAVFTVRFYKGTV